MAISCIPESSYDDGKLLLIEKKEDDIPKSLFFVINALSTPITVIFGAIGACYYLVKSQIIQPYKIYKLQQKINAINTTDNPDKINLINIQRISKLNTKLQNLSDVNILSKATFDFKIILFFRSFLC